METRFGIIPRSGVLLSAVLALALQPASVAAWMTRTIHVSNIDDNNPAGSCTLGEAIDLGNAGAGHGLAANGYWVTQHGGTPPIYRLVLPDILYS
jgi:hypothetical protein